MFGTANVNCSLWCPTCQGNKRWVVTAATGCIRCRHAKDGSSRARKACIRRDILRQPRCSSQRWKKRTEQCVFAVLCVYCCFLLYMPDCWLEVSIWNVLRPATSTQVFLGFPASISKCWDGSQDPKMPLHASHVALLI